MSHQPAFSTDVEREVPVAGTQRLQILMSPYYGRPDFSMLTEDYTASARVDLVSVADLLRNGFVYAPHSIFEDVKLVTLGFDPQHDMHASPEFRYLFRESGRREQQADATTDWVELYHRMLCDAFESACSGIRAPWLLQSGGKDSTPLAIAAAEVRPDTHCITYLGGREENEVASASFVADRLGLRHHTLVCDPGRAYDRYLAIMSHIPLLTADFALLSYIDLAAEILAEGGDGIVDGIGADSYFGISVHRREQLLLGLARGLRLPSWATELPLLGRNFEFCYLLSTLQMNPIERVFPGSRFTDVEVDALFGRGMARASQARLALFRPEITSATSADERWAMANSIAGIAGGFGKGLYTASAMSMQVAYPFCDSRLREWVYREVPSNLRIDPVKRANKVLVRRYIAARFGQLPYVARKGSFRFDLCGLAKDRFEQVHDFASQAGDVLPGAVAWLERNRSLLDNKYHASKFYLLAIVLPWLVQHACKVAPLRERVQITMSPYYGRPDFSALDGGRRPCTELDPVSMADLLRNGFVYPPHSIFEGVKLATFGFDPRHDMHGTPQYRFGFRDSGKLGENAETDLGQVATYHRLLCEAVADSCADLQAPWMLQSGGKDSTTLAIAVAEARPDTTCITYLGGHEENEIASARHVATTLGLRHETLLCDPGRAYDRYLAMMPRMPLLTADFALLSYVDMAATIAGRDGDGVIDGLGSDAYFGMPMARHQRALSWLARGLRLPPALSELPWVERSFRLCFALSTLQMDPVERLFPGSRFTDAEVDHLFGREIAGMSKARLALFQSEIASATSGDERRVMMISVAESASAFAKGIYTTSALSLRLAYPFCDHRLRDWVYRQVPADQLVDPVTRANKVLVRRHIETRFKRLPYVAHKGSFRFDLCGLARSRFDQVHAYARQTREVLPGSIDWLERNRLRLDNKYHASKFYLLAIVLPWIQHHCDEAGQYRGQLP